jgi:ATP-dependent RNA helicase SUPV3L1/SUV3
MSRFVSAPVAAVLGPTNTGKTYLAIERLCGHSSGMIGFPLRLLAREVYDRVVAIKGPKEVALITGEERILPAGARWFLCTAESMPIDRDLAFVAVDEAQLGIDHERGHVFTDRILRARGREETMILGSDSLRPMLRHLLPDAAIVARPRFSTLSYAGAKKLSRLPPRSVVVAFSAEEVYAAAEMLRRTRGGAAVVMGALSPRTRNAQVAMYQAGEVDYLVATDAVGMGLNLDVAHVAFAGLSKFDGRRQRRLTIPEMAQIAGRAGRHQRDGTFGTLSVGDDSPAFTDAEIAAIEEHRFAPLDFLYWRNGEPSFAGIDALIASLDERPPPGVLRPAPEAIDLMVLRRLASEDWVRERTTQPAMVARLWAACGLPDFRRTGPEQHAVLVGRLFRHLSEGTRHLPPDWIAAEIAHLDNVQGDVETLSHRIAAARTWAYIAHRADWLSDPEQWAARTSALEERLSDALHERLTQRFVDRRTAVLLRELAGADPASLPMAIDDDGTVSVAGEPIGRLDGFKFRVDPTARVTEKRRLLAAAERRLTGEMTRRAAALAEDGDEAFALLTDPGRPVAVAWDGHVVARLDPGRVPLLPRISLARSLETLRQDARERVTARLARWLETSLARVLAPLREIEALAAERSAPAPLRALLAPLAAAGGVLERAATGVEAASLDREMRRVLQKAGVRLGTLDLFLPLLLKPEATRWRLALWAVHDGDVMPVLPVPGAATLTTPGEANEVKALVRAGFRPLGTQMLRVDLVERVARAVHDGRAGRKPFAPDPGFATSLALRPESFARLMQTLGFKPTGDRPAQWVWRGLPAPKRMRPPSNGAFSALAGLRRSGG